MALLASPLWPAGTPPEESHGWQILAAKLRDVDPGFDIWIDWYEDRLAGKPFDWRLERAVVESSDEQWSQSPAEINAYLKSVLSGAAAKQLNRARAIFLGHGGVGKTSLIRALHGENVVAGDGEMTKGIAISESIHEGAGVFTRETDFKDRDITVHFWDFGGQVMAHATHQFFLRAGCLYVIVLGAREERNANEEAEYWLEHVRAYGENAPVLLVGNKADQVQLNLDMRALKEKHPNVCDFYPLSCTEAKGRFQLEFDRFTRDFNATLITLGSHGQRFTDPQFAVLKAIQDQAKSTDLIRHDAFDQLCADKGIAAEGPQDRGQLLDLFDKLGIVLHFPKLSYLREFVLNPRWLTYGVYTIMYSTRALAQKGRLSDADIVAILREASLAQADETKRAFKYPADRCRLIVDAMVAFQVAYRVSGTDQLVIPGLLDPSQPDHGFDPEGAIEFQFDFQGFLPRHVLPALIVSQHIDIARDATGHEIVWQNGVRLKPIDTTDADALVRADYHDRTIEVMARGSDAASYLGVIRHAIRQTLKTMPELQFEEKVRLRPEMQIELKPASLRDKPVWLSYEIIRTAQRSGIKVLPGPDGALYSVDKIMAVMPVSPDLVPADVFISYSKKDLKLVDNLYADLRKAGIRAWFDKELLPHQPFREALMERIDQAKAVVVVWTEESVKSKWVKAEASRADGGGKLICLREPGLKSATIPEPFPANMHMAPISDRDALFKSLDALGVKRRV